MGKLKKKGPGEEHGKYPPLSRSGDELETYIWCFANRITIGPKPLWKDEYGKWTVEIRLRDEVHEDPGRYTKWEAMEKVYEYCDYYYNKYKKNDK